MWEKDDRTGCSYTPMSQEELAEPSTPGRPSLVSDAPDVGQDLWHPLLADSEHAYAWWMLSQDELQTIIAEIQDRAEKKATSRMTGTTPKQQVVIKKEKPTPKPKGTTSKSGSSEAITPAKPKSSAASPAQSFRRHKKVLYLENQRVLHHHVLKSHQLEYENSQIQEEQPEERNPEH